MTTEHVRIDKWLWAARFFKTRSLATDAIELGRVRIAGERIKPAREARIGEALEIAIGEQRLEVVVRALSAVRGPALAARQLYVETEESVRRREQRAEARRLGAEPAQAIRGRPTKREGRALRRVRNGP
jgi:ribosome-associated heat shock protein Hsp15